MRRSALLLLSMAAVAACSDGAPPIAMLASIDSNVLSTSDTLVIRRTISNGGRNTIWVNVSSGAPPYTITGADAKKACYQPGSTMELALQSVEPNESRDFEFRLPLQWVTACASGAYQIEINALIHDTDGGTPTHTLHSARVPLTITAP